MDKNRPGTYRYQSKISDRQIRTAVDRSDRNCGTNVVQSQVTMVQSHNSQISESNNDEDECNATGIPEFILGNNSPIPKMDPLFKYQLRSKILANSKKNVEAFRSQLNPQFYINEQIEDFIRLKWFQRLEKNNNPGEHGSGSGSRKLKSKDEKSELYRSRDGGGDGDVYAKIKPTFCDKKEGETWGIFGGGGDAEADTKNHDDASQKDSEIQSCEWKIDFDSEASEHLETKNISSNKSNSIPEPEVNMKNWTIKDDNLLKMFQVRVPFKQEMENDGESNRKFYEVTIQNNIRRISLVSSQIIQNLKEFIHRPVPIGIILKCRINRLKHGIGTNIFPQYCFQLELDDGKHVAIIYARKRKKAKSSCYIFSTNSNDLVRNGQSYAGKLKCSNMVGTQFRMFSNGESPKKATSYESELREELGIINFEPNVLGLKGPRKMQLKIPSLITQFQRYAHRPQTEFDNHSSSSLEFSKNVIVLHNKYPIWNPKYSSHTLDFGSRATIASVKNFQIILEGNDDRVLLQFGKIDEEVFNVDFGCPFSPFQAFAIGISSLEPKLGCE